MNTNTQPECPCKSGDVNRGSSSNPSYPNEAYCPWCGHSYGPVASYVDSESGLPRTCEAEHIEGFCYDHETH